MTSSRSPDELGDIIARGLADAGLRESGAFDGTRFFRLNNVTQLELRVWSEDSQSGARLHLPSVRSQSGRPQRLAPVGNALAAAEHSVRSADPTATISCRREFEQFLGDMAAQIAARDPSYSALDAS
jgi:hypothetical protein